MPIISNSTTHHILVASEQLWPNLLGLYALIDRDGGIRSLSILHTDDKMRSAAPAKKLASLATKIQPDVITQLIRTGVTSQEVIGVIHSIIQQFTTEPGEHHFSINATGGTKTMFAGLVPWVRRQNIEAFYREVTGLWFQLVPHELDGLHLLACDEWAAAATARLTLPVDELATIQASHPEGATWHSQAATTMDIPGIVASGIKNNWDWKRLQLQYPELGNDHSGFAFELFFGALILACGADNVVLNLEMKHEGLKRQEFDVLVSTGERILLFDLKLTDADSDATINQISRIGEDRRSLGGLNAVAIAIRPSWKKDEATTLIANSHHVRIWTQEDMPMLVRQLRELIGISAKPLNADLQTTVELLHEASANGNRLFSRSAFLPSAKISIEQKVGWVNMHSYWLECLNNGMKAMAIDLGGRFLVRYSLDKYNWRNVQVLQSRIPVDLNIEWFHCGKTAKTAFVILSCHTQKNQILMKFINSMVGPDS